MRYPLPPPRRQHYIDATGVNFCGHPRSRHHFDSGQLAKVTPFTGWTGLQAKRPD